MKREGGTDDKIRSLDHRPILSLTEYHVPTARQKVHRPARVPACEVTFTAPAELSPTAQPHRRIHHHSATSLLPGTLQITVQ